MIPIVPVIISVTIFGVVGWALNKGLTKLTGRNLDENLDYAEGKVLELVRREPENEDT